MQANDICDLGVANNPMHTSRRYSTLEEIADELQHQISSPKPHLFGSWNFGWKFSTISLTQIFLLASIILITPSIAAAVTFENCISPNIINSNQLQFSPLFVNATFNSTAVSHNLNVTVYGDVMGTANQQDPPNRTDPRWSNPNETIGKIPDVGPSNIYTTLKASFNVLDYTPYTAPPSRFCNATLQQRCPIVPAYVAYP